MKKTITLVVLLIQMSLYSFSQKEIAFSLQYKPSTKYIQTATQVLQTEVNYAGDEDFLKNLKDQGIQNPTVVKKETEVESELVTGKLTDGVHYPVKIEFIKSTSKDGEAPIPAGTVIYGQGTVGKSPTLDSIYAPGLTDAIKKTLLQTTLTAMSQINLPEKKMKVGDEFSQETPLSIPMGPTKLEMAITTIYKLKSIKGGMANFDIVLTYTMNTTVSDHKLDANGKGSGTMLYDIKNNFYNTMQIDSDMQMKMAMDKINLDIKVKTSSQQKAIVTRL